MFTEDLSVFFAEFGVQATWTPSGITATVILDSPDAGILGDLVLTTQYEMTYQTSDFAGLDYGANLSINGAQYTVKDTKRLDDGAFSKASLSKT